MRTLNCVGSCASSEVSAGFQRLNSLFEGVFQQIIQRLPAEGMLFSSTKSKSPHCVEPGHMVESADYLEVRRAEKDGIHRLIATLAEFKSMF